jgi:hypothetical protein
MLPSDEPGVSDDDLRFAPPLPVSAGDAEPDAEPESQTVTASVFDLPVTDGLDIAAALAAVSTLSDMVAEQEAAEQARIAREEAAEQLRQERQARLEHPERFFPVPPLMTPRRGQISSLVPALALLLVGAWLTLMTTTDAALPAPGFLIALAGVGLGAAFIARWLASRRWARGSLFAGLALLLLSITFYYLTLPLSAGLAGGWPLLLIALGAAVALTGALGQPRERRLLAVGLALLAAGGAALAVTLGLLPDVLLSSALSFAPVVLGVAALISLLPVVFRQRR